MTKEDILEYISHTPHNTNPNMIGNMIDTLITQGGGGGLVVHTMAQGYNVLLSETYRAIKTAMDAGKTVVVIRDDLQSESETSIVESCVDNGENYFRVAVGRVEFVTESEDGYPVNSGK